MIPNNHTLYIILLIVLLPFTFAADILFGSVYIPVGDMLHTIFSHNSDSIATIMLKIRVPRALTAIVAGVALPISGLLMQTFFRNPLAGPDILGISTGASLGVALYSLAGGVGSVAIISSFATLSSIGYILAASAGACLVMLVIAAITPRIHDAASLLIIGIMFSSITSSVVSVLQFFSNPEQVHEFILWTFGSFSGIQLQQIWFMIIIIAPLLCIVFFMQKPLNALLMGENYAKSMGINILRLRLAIVIVSSVLAGIVTAFTGPIGFVGMAVPHIARMIFKTAHHKILIIASALIGAHLLLLCDLLSQLPGTDAVLPINVVTSMFGAPIVILIIMKNKKTRLHY